MSSKFSLQEKSILITGATSGIGRACAVSYAQENAKLFLCGRNNESLLQLKNDIPDASLFEVDLSSDEKVELLVNSLEPVDCIVLVAGIDKRTPLKFISDVEINNVMQTNLIANIKLIRSLAKAKKINKGASIVLIASVAGMLADAGHLLYGVSKAGIISLARALAVELAPRKVRVNAISPGLIRTPMTEAFLNDNPELATLDSKKYLLGHGEVHSIVDTTQFLLSDASSWITGTNMVVDGGYSCQK